MPLKDVVTLGGRNPPERTSIMGPMVNLQREVDGFFNLIGGQMAMAPLNSFGLLAVDVRITDRGMIINADIPGVKQEHVHLKLADDALVINGKKNTERQESGENYHIMERGYGHFRRVIPIPFEADVKEIEAELQNGVLTVKIPKSSDTISQDYHIKIKGK